MSRPSRLIAPYGGTLCDLYADEDRRRELLAASRDWPSWTLTPRQSCDLELLMNGGFSPLRGFMTRADYDGVVSRMRLADGALWPIPVALDIGRDAAEKLTPGQTLALRDGQGNLLAALRADDIWEPDLEEEAAAVYSSRSGGPCAKLDEHPGVQRLRGRTGPVCVGGPVEGLRQPVHYDYPMLRHGPAELRAAFSTMGWRLVVAFQTRNPLHRAHRELTIRAVQEAQASLLVHPVVGDTRPGDLDHYTRVRCYQAVMPTYPHNTAMLSLLPLAMRMAGPREALWHALIRRNFGCSHLIVGRDHAGPGQDSSGVPFYAPTEAQELLREHEAETGVGVVAFEEMVYVPEMGALCAVAEAPKGARTLRLSGSELRRRLSRDLPLPSWFTFPEVEKELRRAAPPRRRRGFVVFFTGLSGAGKSTIAGALMVKLREVGDRPVTLLDGDIVRLHLSSELGFSKEHRDINIRRIGFVASEIAKNGGIALCAPIAPYEAVREEVRNMVEPAGGFVLVHVATPLEVCEGRDPKGLYAKARAGLVKQFTGVSDKYEEPRNADLAIDTTEMSPEEAAHRVVLHLEREGYIAAAE